jgi:protein TorT
MRIPCSVSIRSIFGLVTSGLVVAGIVSMAGDAQAWSVEVRTPPFQWQASRKAEIRPLAAASKPWRICALYPHLKDSYWLSINYGMVAQARALGVELKVLDAGGYHRVDEQLAQIDACRAWKADALLLGAVSFAGRTDELKAHVAGLPVFGLVNDVPIDTLVGRVATSWYAMGHRAGEFIAARHPAGSKGVKIAWFPGASRWSDRPSVELGFFDALKSASVRELVIKEGSDNDRRILRALLEDALKEHHDIDYVVGGAILAETALVEVGQIEAARRPKVISYYFTHGVYRGLLRGKIQMAVTDQMVLLGQLSLDQVSRFLDGKPFETDIAPSLQTLTSDTSHTLETRNSLSPARFSPVFEVRPARP